MDQRLYANPYLVSTQSLLPVISGYRLQRYSRSYSAQAPLSTFEKLGRDGEDTINGIDLKRYNCTPPQGRAVFHMAARIWFSGLGPHLLAHILDPPAL
jgi:hypothetical protein